MKQIKFHVMLKSGQIITQPVNVPPDVDVNQVSMQMLAQISTIGVTQMVGENLKHYPAHHVDAIEVEIPRVEVVPATNMPPLKPHLIKG